ncbi:O-antigen ligase [Rhizobiales bacterium GAS188]|nr:O-antigen ligase [Rhizobiales bacterium GAS188]
MSPRLDAASRVSAAKSLDGQMSLDGQTSLDERIEAGGASASRLATLAMLLFAALPVAMAVANRSAPLVLALAAVAALASAGALTGRSAVGSAFVSAARSRIGLASLAFVLVSVASYGWSADRVQTLRALTEVAVPLIAGAVILQILPRNILPSNLPQNRLGVAPRTIALPLAVGAIVAALICIGELRFNMPIRNALHLRAKTFEYNRPVLSLLVWFWPLCTMAMSAPRRHIALWAALAVTTVAIWSSQSGTAMFAQGVSVAACLLAWRFPRLVLGLAAIAVSFVFVGVFAFGDIAWRVLPQATYDVFAWMHAADRVEIWRSYGAAMLLHPWLGAGFGASVTLGDTAIVGQVADEFRRMLAVGHPHNGYLQIGVELGLIGCALALAVALMLLWSWRDLRGPALLSRLGLFGTVAATMLVGHGAWQAWWIAVVFAGGALIRVAYSPDPAAPPQPESAPKPPAPKPAPLPNPARIS